MKKRNQKRYDPAFKARVALGAMREDDSLAQLGHRHGIHPVLVGRESVQRNDDDGSDASQPEGRVRGNQPTAEIPTNR